MPADLDSEITGWGHFMIFLREAGKVTNNG